MEDGGVLISEAFFGAYKDDGYHSAVTPGFGMDELFGVRETRVIQNDYVYLTPGNAQGLRYQEELKKSGGGSAEITAHFQNGTPAAAVNSYGKGKAVYIGTLLSCAYHNTKDTNTLAFIKSLLCDSEVKPYVRCDTPNIRIDVLTGGSGTAVIFNNNSGNDTDVTFCADIKANVSSMTDIFTGEIITLERENDKLCGKINIAAWECRCFVVNS